MKSTREFSFLLILAFIAIYFVWGTTYLANLFALDGMKPFVVSALRFLIAGIILVCWGFYKKLLWPDMQMIRVLAISGIVMLVGGSGLVIYAEQYINSGYAAVVIATEPLWFVLLDKKRWTYYFSNVKILAGLLIGFTGIALFSYFTPGSSTEAADDRIFGTLILLISAVLWVLGTLYASNRIKPGSSNLINTTVQLLAAGIFSAVVALFIGEWSEFSPEQISIKAWGGLAFLIVMGSLIAYMAFIWLVTVQPPAVVSTHTYVNPVVAIAIGWWLAEEQVEFTQLLALVVILAGVYLTQTSKKDVL